MLTCKVLARRRRNRPPNIDEYGENNGKNARDGPFMEMLSFALELAEKALDGLLITTAKGSIGDVISVTKSRDVSDHPRPPPHLTHNRSIRLTDCQLKYRNMATSWRTRYITPFEGTGSFVRVKRIQYSSGTKRSCATACYVRCLAVTSWLSP